MGMQGMRPHLQRRNIGDYSGKKFQDLGKLKSSIHI